MNLLEASHLLQKAKIKQAEQEALDLLALANGHSRAQLLLRPPKISTATQKKFNLLIKKRVQGVPFAYLAGFQPFLGLNFLVTKDTLIPRPATEDLVLAVEKYLSPVRNNIDSTRGNNYSSKHQIYAKRNNISNGINIFDLGTGSGCIAISLALDCPDKIKSIIATDISIPALKIAKKNYQLLALKLWANSHELAHREKRTTITFKKTDLLKNITLPPKAIIVANLPYVKLGRADKETSAQPKNAIFCEYKNGLPVPYLKLINQIKKQKNQPLAVFLEMPKICSQKYQILWRATLPTVPIFIIST